MQPNLSSLFGPSTEPVSLYELIPLAILVTLLCVTAAVVAFKLVSLFFRKDRKHGAPGSIDALIEGSGRWKAFLWRFFFPEAGRERLQLIDEVKRLLLRVSADEQEKILLTEQNAKAQKRMHEMQREIEVLQGSVKERRSELDEESEELEAVRRHSLHLEKQLEEIMVELERIYKNAQERPSPIPSSSTAAESAQVKVTPVPADFNPVLDERDQHAEKLKSLLNLYRERVKERKL